MEIRRLFKEYRTNKSIQTLALRDVSLTLPDKGMVFVVGKSGCGKSTLLNILGGLDKPTSGMVITDGKQINYDKEQYLDEYRKKHIGFVFQDHLLIEDLTVFENVKNVLELQGKSCTQEEVDDVLADVGLLNVANRLPNALSGGQRQRVAIARALIKAPSIILADEPTGNLDSESGKAVFEILKEISQKTLVLVVSHDLASAYQYADRLIELKDGVIAGDKQRVGDFDFQTIHSAIEDSVKEAFADVEPIDAAPDAEMTEKSKPHSDLSYGNAMRISLCWLKQTIAKPKLCLSLVASVLLLSLALAALAIFNDMRAFDYYNATANTLRIKDYHTVMLLKNDLYHIGDETETERSVIFTKEETEDVQRIAGNVLPAYSFSYEFPKLTDEDDNEYDSTLFGFCEMDMDEPSPLDDFYHAYLSEGNYPHTNPNAVEILLSDYIAESIVYYGCDFANGRVLPNTLPTEIIGKTFESNGIDFLIVGIYSCDYTESLHEKAKNDERFDYAQRYVFPVAICAKDTIVSYASTLLGIKLTTEMYAQEGDVALNYTCVVVGAGDLGRLEKYANGSHVAIKYGKGVTANAFPENGIMLSFSRYLELFNEYEYDDDGNMTATFDSVTTEQIDGRVTVRFSEDTHDYLLVGIYDDSQLQSDLTLISDHRRERYVRLLLQAPTLFLSIENDGRSVSALMDYVQKQEYFVYAPFTERLIFFRSLIEVLKNLIVIANVVLLVFVMILMANFIGKSIRDRQIDIGIMRANGATQMDIAKLFVFFDLFYIVLSFILAICFYAVGVAVFNASVSAFFLIPVRILSVNLLSILLMLGLALGVVTITSYLPIRKYAQVAPIDIIKGTE